MTKIVRATLGLPALHARPQFQNSKLDAIIYVLDIEEL